MYSISERRVPLQADRAVFKSMVKTSETQSEPPRWLPWHPESPSPEDRPLTLGWQEWMASSRILPWTTASHLEPFSACQCSAPGGLNLSLPSQITLFRPLLSSVNQPMRRSVSPVFLLAHLSALCTLSTQSHLSLKPRPQLSCAALLFGVDLGPGSYR